MSPFQGFEHVSIFDGLHPSLVDITLSGFIDFTLFNPNPLYHNTEPTFCPEWAIFINIG